MSFLDAVRLAFQTIRAQKLKSGFSIIGVFIGVMFLIAVVSVVEGMNRYMTDKFAGTLLGVNTFRLRQFPDVQLGNVTDSMWRSWMRRPRVSYEDAQAVAHGMSVPVVAAWESNTRATLSAGRRQAKDVQVTAATELYFDIRSLTIEAGRAFTGQEVLAGVPVVVIGHDLAEKLFEGQDPIGREVKIFDIPTASSAWWRSRATSSGCRSTSSPSRRPAPRCGASSIRRGSSTPWRSKPIRNPKCGRRCRRPKR